MDVKERIQSALDRFYGLFPDHHLAHVVVASVGAALIVAAGAWLALDVDGDELSAWSELSAGTSPVLRDSDRDGLPDGWETARGLDARASDTDGDEVSDGLEVRLGSDPIHIDSDNDGLLDGVEFTGGTDPTKADTDDDRAHDAVEIALGTDPLDPDTDGDGVQDGAEIAARADPFRSDSDGDGIADLTEMAGPDRDCDGDGDEAIIDLDDDADGYFDGQELLAWRCNPDVDGDGVLDGDEGAPECVVEPDCDGDGLPDADEAILGYDPLDPDTFDVGLLDAVVKAFDDRGQAAGKDEDQDGIPDPWESSTGLIAWNTLQPRVGQRDFLVEFLRVQGPDSGDFRHLNFRPAYDRVAQAFAAAGIHLDWVETRVLLPSEQRPPLLPSSDTQYYSDVLAQGAFSDNPYVTTVVMNPQHDQSQILHAGIAPIRGMLATVDYGQYADLLFQAPDERLYTFSPWLESLIAADRQDAIPSLGYTRGGILSSGEYWADAQNARVVWTPHWYQTAPRFEFFSGNTVQTTLNTSAVRIDALASVIMHELGHTLGLCHTEDFGCRSRLSDTDQAQYTETSMYTPNAEKVLAFLDSQWDQVRAYIDCPPVEPVLAVAEQRPSQEIVAAKYEVTLEQATSVDRRACLERAPIERSLAADHTLGSYQAPYGAQDAAQVGAPGQRFVAPAHMRHAADATNDPTRSILFALVAIAAAGAAGYLPVHQRARRELEKEAIDDEYLGALEAADADEGMDEGMDDGRAEGVGDPAPAPGYDERGSFDETAAAAPGDPALDELPEVAWVGAATSPEPTTQDDQAQGAEAQRAAEPRPDPATEPDATQPTSEDHAPIYRDPSEPHDADGWQPEPSELDDEDVYWDHPERYEDPWAKRAKAQDEASIGGEDPVVGSRPQLDDDRPRTAAAAEGTVGLDSERERLAEDLDGGPQADSRSDSPRHTPRFRWPWSKER